MTDVTKKQESSTAVAVATEEKPKARRRLGTNSPAVRKARTAEGGLYVVAVAVKTKKASTHVMSPKEVETFLSEKDAAKVGFSFRIVSSDELLEEGQQRKLEWMVLIIEGGAVVVPTPVVTSWSFS